jgi:hypothetical protein
MNSAKGGTVRDVVVESYRLISIDPTAAPNGSAGEDWLVYRIAQGKNIVTGYRRGSRQNATAEVERIVNALNERLLVNGRPYRSAGRPPKKTPPRHKDLI